MNSHELGAQLRALVIQERNQGRPLDPRLLQAAIGDLCAAEHAELLAPLRYLVLSPPFASAVAQDPPLADGAQLPRLQQELAQMYAAPLCQRLQPVLEGLLGLASAAAMPQPVQPMANPAPATTSFSAPAPAFPQAPASASTPAAVTYVAQPVAASGSGSGSGAMALLLAFASGVLLIVLAGLGLLLWQRQQQSVIAVPASQPTPVAEPPAAVPPAGTQAAPSIRPAPSGSLSQTEAVDRSVSSIQDLYAALSSKDFARAGSLYGPAAADQFDPSFFQKFERVSVQDLRSTSVVGSTVNLDGVVTFVWPDGSLQTETRSFSVDTSSVPALITASEFGRVLRSR